MEVEGKFAVEQTGAEWVKPAATPSTYQLRKRTERTAKKNNSKGFTLGKKKKANIKFQIMSSF